MNVHLMGIFEPINPSVHTTSVQMRTARVQKVVTIFSDDRVILSPFFRKNNEYKRGIILS